MMTKKITAHLLFLLTSFFTFVCTEMADAAFVWDWDSGTTEGWVDASGGTIVTIEPGRFGTFGLGAREPLFGAPGVKIEGQTIDPSIFVGGQFGEYLPMTEEIYVDIDRKISPNHGDYVDLWIYGNNSYGRFVCYPYDNYGNVEELVDEWFRHHFANRWHYEYVEESYEAGTIFLVWNWNYNATERPVVFDNLTIVPEPATFLLLGLGGILIRRKIRNQK